MNLLNRTSSTKSTTETPRNSIVVQFSLLILVPIVIALGAKFFVTPFLYRLADDFIYRADLISLDNFYNEENGQFIGEKRSVTRFEYDYLRGEENGVVVSSIFDIKTVEGDQIIRIEREYGIDPKSWQHRFGVGDKDRSGYLFAPRKLKKDQSYAYWHINYDRELELNFENEEIIDGLKVYRYTTSFGVDQTDDLTHLDGVPESRGINLDVSLSIWVEPTSGWLIKYEDSAIAYYYDIEGGNRLHPWNKFKNTYRPASINDQIQIARLMKAGIVGSEVLIPLFMFILIASVITWKSNRKIASLIFIGGIIIITFWLATLIYTPFNRQDPITIGISRWVPGGNLEYDRNIEGFKKRLASTGYIEGKDVIYIEETANADRNRQDRIIHEYLEKDVGLIYSLTTPGTLIVRDIVPNRPIVFSIVTYPVEVGLIDSLTQSGNNLVGTRNWVSVSQQLTVFREIIPGISSIGFIHRANEPNSNIQLEEIRKEAEQRDIQIIDIAVNSTDEIQSALNNEKENFDSIYSACDTLVQGEGEELIISFAHTHKIPSFSCNASGPEKGDLVGVVADFEEIGKLAGEKAGLILDGASPSSLETSTVARPFIIVNQNTADLLGIDIPQTILANAQKIIR